MKYKTEFELFHLETHQANLGDESVDLWMSEHILLVHPAEVFPFIFFFYKSYSIDRSKETNPIQHLGMRKIISCLVR